MDDVVSPSRDQTECRALLERLADFYDRDFIGLFYLDTQGVIVDAATGETSILARQPREELIGKALSSFLPGDERGIFERKLAKLQHVDRAMFEGTFRSPAGEEAPVVARVKACRSKASGLRGAYALVADVSERRLAQEARRKKGAIVDAMPEGLIVFHLDGTVAEVNPVYEQMTGRQREEIVGRSGLEVAAKTVAPGELERIIEAFQTALSGEAIPTLRTVLVRPDGHEIPIYFTTSFMKGPEGNVAGIVSMVKDITELVTAEQALRESEMKLRLLVEQSLQGLVIAQGFPPRLVFANQVMADILGYPVEELQSLPVERSLGLLGADDRAVVLSRYGDRLEGKAAPAHYEFRVTRRDGEVRWLEIVANRIEYRGQPAVQAAFVDITERKRAEEVLRAAHGELETRVKERTAELAKANEALRRSEEEERQFQGRLSPDYS